MGVDTATPLGGATDRSSTSASGDGSRLMPLPQTQPRSAGERVTAYVPNMSEYELLSWLHAGNVPTTDQEKNDKFFLIVITCATLEALETLPLAELECEKRNIVVEASADLSLKSDCADSAPLSVLRTISGQVADLARLP